MGLSYLSIIRSRDVYLVHVCSQCHMAILSTVQITAFARIGYTYDADQAEGMVEKVARSALAQEVRHLDACCRDKTSFDWKGTDEPHISRNLSCRTTLRHLGSPCPGCGRVEPWESFSARISLSGKRLTELDASNFPKLYETMEDADRAAKELVTQMIAQVNQARKNSEVVQQARQAAAVSAQKVKAVQEEFRDIPEEKEKEQLSSQLAERKARKAKIGILDIKRNSENKKAIASLEATLAQLDQTIQQKRMNLKWRLNQALAEFLQNQALAYGCTSNFLIQYASGAQYYFYLAADTPSEPASSVCIHQDNHPAPARQDSPPLQGPGAEKHTYCSYCGFKLLPESRYCTKCGKKVTQEG